MKIQKSTGIVLSSNSIGEADYSSRIYLKESGKRNFLFKGLKKSKRRSHLIVEPGTVAELVYYFHEDRSFQIVKEYHIHAHFPEIRNNYQKILLLHFFLETVDKTSGFNDANKMVFDLLVSGIETIINSESLTHLSAFFVIHLLRLHGILSGFKQCKICGKEDFQQFAIDIADFQPICPGCANQYNNTLFDISIRDYLYQTLGTKFTSIDLSKYNENEILKFFFHLCLFLQSYFHIELKSKDMLISEFS